MFKESVGIDIDGVLADIHTPALQILKDEYGWLTQYEDIVDWSFLQLRYRISHNKFLRVLDDVWQDWTNVPFAEETQLQDLSLLQHDYNIVLITKRTKKSLPYVMQWLMYHNFKFHELIFVMSDRQKLDFPVQYLIDDSPKIIKEAEGYPEKFVYLRMQPWNKNLQDLPTNVIRVKSLHQAALLLIDRIKWKDSISLKQL